MNKLACVFLATSALFFASFDAGAHWVDSIKAKAKDGDPSAQFELGRLHAGGGNPVEYDLDKAFSLINKSAEQGFLMAKSWLCVYYANPNKYKDRELSLSWCKIAAREGDNAAQNMIGSLYLFGDNDLGITMNESKAFALYSASALGGNINSQHMVSFMLLEGTGVERDLVSAYAWSLTEAYFSPYASPSIREKVAMMLSDEQIDMAENISKNLIERVSKGLLQPVDWLK